MLHPEEKSRSAYSTISGSHVHCKTNCLTRKLCSTILVATRSRGSEDPKLSTNVAADCLRRCAKDAHYFMTRDLGHSANVLLSEVLGSQVEQDRAQQVAIRTLRMGWSRFEAGNSIISRDIFDFVDRRTIHDRRKNKPVSLEMMEHNTQDDNVSELGYFSWNLQSDDPTGSTRIRATIHMSEVCRAKRFIENFSKNPGECHHDCHYWSSCVPGLIFRNMSKRYQSIQFKLFFWIKLEDWITSKKKLIHVWNQIRQRYGYQLSANLR